MSSSLERQIRKVHSRISDVDKWYQSSEEIETETEPEPVLFLLLLLKRSNLKRTNCRDFCIDDTMIHRVLMMTEKEMAYEARFRTGR